MALQLNLLHEEILQRRQRQRDPIKIGTAIALSIFALLALYYLWQAYEVLSIRNRLSIAQHDWSKVEPKVTAAQKRASELNSIIGTTKVLDQIIEDRFYWAPLLQTISHCVTPNIQIIGLEGAIAEDGTNVTIALEGVAGGREPRAVAEDFRQMLLEQIGKEHADVKVEFKTLEDLDTLVNVGGSNMTTARFNVSVKFNLNPSRALAPVPAPRRARKTEDAKAD